MSAGDVGDISYPARATESVLAGAARRRSTPTRSGAASFRIVVDYGFSAASFVLPLVLGPLGVEAVSAHAFATDRSGQPRRCAGSSARRRSSCGAIGADLGVVFDRAAERLYLVDERGREIPVEQALLLFLRLIAGSGRKGKLAFPVTVTSQVDQIVEGSGLEVVRTPASLADLTGRRRRTASSSPARSAAATSSRSSCPAYDAVASLCKLLELLAPRRPAALGARRRAAVADARAPPDHVPVGAQGLRHARAHRAAQGPRRRPHRRDQGLRRARLGAGAARPGRAARPRLRRGADAGESAELEGELRSLIEERAAGGDRRRRGQYPQAEVDPSGSCCFNRSTPIRTQPKGPRGIVPRSRNAVRPGAEGPDPTTSSRRRTRSRTAAASCTGRSTSSARSSSRACAERRRGGEPDQRGDVDRLTEILAAKGAPPPKRTRLSHVYCPECGFQNPESANYCARCGTLLVKGEEPSDVDADVHRRGAAERGGAARRHRRRGAGARRPLGRRPGGRALPAVGRSARSIGRSPDCDIFLDDVTVSRRHAVLVDDGGRFSIEDQGSLNGTFVNRARDRQGRARGRRRGADRQVPADVPRAMTRARAREPRRPAHDRRGVPARSSEEFPDISISKIRYLEDQGLLTPRRTQGGYRLFSEEDVERLRTILRLQRDEFLPLRVIRQELASPAAATASAAGAVALGEQRGRDRPRTSSAARGHRRPSSRASSRSFGLLATRRGGGGCTRRATSTWRRRARELARFGLDAAAPAPVPHVGRPRGRAARAGVGAGPARAERRAPQAGTRRAETLAEHSQRPVPAALLARTA